jgi:DNA (cytosine-5)-methyltransferase 1
MECRWQVEIDPFCRRVLEKHWPDVRRFEDVREVGQHNLEAVDLICGGFPCQDLSIAGRRAGLEGERSGLWFEFARIIRQIRPRWVVVENVPGLLSIDNGQGFGTVLRDLAESGYDAEWRIISACEFGAPHTRERLFIVAYPTSSRQQGDKRSIILQKVHNGAFETLDTWNGSSHPYSNIQERMATPGTCRVFDGVSSELAIRPALRVFGNAVVPQVAEWIGRRIVKEAGCDS